MDKISIIKQGDGWICIEKPAGISVHNEPGKDILSILAVQLATSSKQGDPGKVKPPALLQPVHRLDKETSGLLLLAVTPEALTRLSDLFARGQVKKKYQALVHGNFDPSSSRTGLWEMPLSKDAGGRNNPAGSGKKVEARTQYRVMVQSPHYTLLEIDLFTGRTHQIRRHAKLAGHPVTGDTRYGTPRSVKFLKKACNYHRLGLHGCRLEFQEGDSWVKIVSEQIPLEMQTLLTRDAAGE